MKSLAKLVLTALLFALSVGRADAQIASGGAQSRRPNHVVNRGRVKSFAQIDALFIAAAAISL